MAAFTISYRLPSGGLKSEVIDAADRASALAQMRSRGITPISVKEGGKLASTTTSASRPLWLKGAVAGFLVVIAAVVAFVCMRPAESPVAPKVEKPKKAVKVEKPMPVAKSELQPRITPVPVTNISKKVAFKDRSTNGMTVAELKRWEILNRPAPGYTNDSVRASDTPAYAIFKHHSENEIAGYLTMEPGENLLGTPRYGQRFEKDFLESLKESIVINDDDTDEDKELKRLMIATKADLQKRVEAGESVGQILLDTRKEIQDMAQCKQLVREQLRELSRDSTMSERDVDDFIAAANKYLEERGIAPLKVGPVARRMLMRRKQGGVNK